MDDADRERLRDAKAELDEQIRQQKAEARGADLSVPPTPGPTLAQQIQLLRDEVAALRSDLKLDVSATNERINAAGQYVKALAADLKAMKAKPRPAAQRPAPTNGAKK